MNVKDHVAWVQTYLMRITWIIFFLHCYKCFWWNHSYKIVFLHWSIILLYLIEFNIGWKMWCNHLLNKICWPCALNLLISHHTIRQEQTMRSNQHNILNLIWFTSFQNLDISQYFGLFVFLYHIYLAWILLQLYRLQLTLHSHKLECP